VTVVEIVAIAAETAAREATAVAVAGIGAIAGSHPTVAKSQLIYLQASSQELAFFFGGVRPGSD
jgi:hypothetical protein